MLVILTVPASSVQTLNTSPPEIKDLGRIFLASGLLIIMTMRQISARALIFGLSAFLGALGLARTARTQEPVPTAYMCMVQCGKTQSTWMRLPPGETSLSELQACALHPDKPDKNPILAFRMAQGPMIITTKDGDSLRRLGMGITAKVTIEREVDARAEDLPALIRSYPDSQGREVKYSYRKGRKGFVVTQAIEVKRVVQIEPVAQRAFARPNADFMLRCEERPVEKAVAAEAPAEVKPSSDEAPTAKSVN